MPRESLHHAIEAQDIRNANPIPELSEKDLKVFSKPETLIKVIKDPNFETTQEGLEAKVDALLFLLHQKNLAPAEIVQVGKWLEDKRKALEELRNKTTQPKQELTKSQPPASKLDKSTVQGLAGAQARQVAPSAANRSGNPPNPGTPARNSSGITIPDLSNPYSRGSLEARQRQETLTATQAEIASLFNKVIHREIRFTDQIPGTNQSYEARIVQLSNQEDGYKKNGGGLVDASILAYKSWFNEQKSKNSESVAKKFILQVAEQIKTADMFGFIPKALIIPGTNFIEFKNKFKGLMHEYGINGLESKLSQEELEAMSVEERMKAFKQQQQAMMFAGEESGGVDVGGERRDMSLDGWLMEGHAREISMLYDKLPPHIQNQINARITGIMMQAGRGAKKTQLVWDVISADTSGSSYQSAIREGIGEFFKTSKQRGYLGGEDILKIAGFVTPETLHALISQGIDNTVYVKDKNTNEIKGIPFNISVQDVWAELYSVKGISELLAVDPLGNVPPIVDGKFDVERSNGYFNLKAKILYRTLFRKMGLSMEDAAAAAGAKTLSSDAKSVIEADAISARKRLDEMHRLGINDEKERKVLNQKLNDFSNLQRGLQLIPEIVATDQLSLIDRQNVDSQDQWVGQYWWMIMDAEGYMFSGRSDFAVVPLETMGRRLNLGLRKILLAHYPALYNMLNTPEQQIHGQNMLPELPATLVDQLVKTLKARVRKPGGTPQAIKARERIVEQLAKIEQMQPSMGREMGMMMLGLGKYEPQGATKEDKIADWKRKVKAGLITGNKVGIARNRLFDFWKDVEFDPAELKTAWNGFDFTELLKMCGCSDGDFRKWRQEERSVIGVSGFNLFKEYANGRLFDLINKEGTSPIKYGLTDGFVRYLGRLQAAVESRWKFSQQAVLDAGISTAKLSGSGKGLDRFNFGQSYTNYPQAVVKIAQETLALAGFGDTKTQQDDLLAFIDLFLEGNLAFTDSSYVVDVDPRKKDIDDSEEASEIGAGNKFVIRALNYKQFRERWAQILPGIGENEIERMLKFMRSEHFYFVNSIEEDSGKIDGTRDKATLVGPHTSYVPSVIRVSHLYSKLRSIAENDKRLRSEYLRRHGMSDVEINEDTEIISINNYEEKLNYLKKKGTFCWNTLTRGAANLSLREVGIIYDTLTSMFGISDTSIKGRVDALLNRRRQELNRNQIIDAVIGPDDLVIERQLKAPLTRLSQLANNDPGYEKKTQATFRQVKGRYTK